MYKYIIMWYGHAFRSQRKNRPNEQIGLGTYAVNLQHKSLSRCTYESKTNYFNLCFDSWYYEKNKLVII